MKGERMQPLLQAWFRERDESARDAGGDIARVMADVPQTRQQGRWWPLPALDRPVSTFFVRELAPAPIPATNGRTSARGFTVFSALKFIAAAAVVALFGGFLLAGVLTTPQGDDEALPAAVTGSPSPMTSEELLSGMVTEEVEPGVFRVVNDGVRDVDSWDWPASIAIVAGQDGSIWPRGQRGGFEIGDTELMDWPLEEQDSVEDFEIAQDGTVWAVVSNEEGSALHSFDGETWTIHHAVHDSVSGGDVEVASGGVVWAAMPDGTFGYLEVDGSTWQTIEMPKVPPAPELPPELEWKGFTATDSDVWAPSIDGVWHYADGVWEYIKYGGPDSGPLPNGVFWGFGMGETASDEMLYRHDGSDWQRWSLAEQRMLPTWGVNADEYAVAPDGSLWAAWTPCAGISRFDGLTWMRYLPGVCLNSMDMAPDGSVWLMARDRQDPGDPPDSSESLFVITHEAVAATE